MYFDDLDDLEDILDSISYDEETISVFTDEEEVEIVNTFMELLYIYIDENPTAYAEPDFYCTIVDEVLEFFLTTTPEIYGNVDFDRGNVDDTIEELFEHAIQMFFNNVVPPRSFPGTFIRHVPNTEEIKQLQNQIDYLAAKPQPEQRTPAWYIFRHNLITASNAYKAFENQSAKNQIIYEKCKPIDMERRSGFVNVDSPLHWGQKYEPLSVMLYERDYDTQVGDFGCIQHDTYSFLGASPDGINIDPTRPSRFGRMLEIKNIVNRVIDGIPKKEYWVQMQLQMETCGLEECDFLETRFKEYENETEFLVDSDPDDVNGKFLRMKNGSPKGIILYFSTNEGKPHYIYKPLDMDLDEFKKWEEKTIEDLSMPDENGTPQYTWIKNLFWYLDEVSCVLVLRNKKWFMDIIDQIQAVWTTIEQERITGYEHRAPNKRVKKTEDINPNTIDKFFNLGNSKYDQPQTGCLLVVKKIGSENVPTPPLPPPIQVIRVRTESFDDTKKNSPA